MVFRKTLNTSLLVVLLFSSVSGLPKSTPTQAIKDLDRLVKHYVSSGRPDSLEKRLTQFILETDSLYLLKPGYLIAKADAYQQMRNHVQWKETFALIPDTSLTRTDQISLRLQDRLLSDSAAAYKLMKRIVHNKNKSDSSVFDKWVHTDFSQYFLPTTLLKDKVKARDLLLRQMADSSEPAISMSTSGLRSWVRAQLVFSDPEALLQEVHSSYAIDRPQDARYNILNCKLLSKYPSLTDTSRHLLDKVIESLEHSIFTSKLDPQVKERYKYLLGYACFTRAQSELQLDSLSKAKDLLYKAFVNTRDLTNRGSFFYDKLMFDGEDDYVMPYIMYLDGAGKSDSALEYISDVALKNPQHATDMQELFERLYPAKSFLEYWRALQEQKQPPAPQFSLKNIQNQNISLSNYAGKWVFLDFWGTWCIPAIAEMPQIERLYNESARDSNSNITVLTIACGDSQTKIEQFTKQNNYSFPILLGDSTLVKQYRVPHFPAHYLITPGGKLINLSSLADWESFIQTYISGSLNNRVSGHGITQKDLTAYVLTPGQEALFDPAASTISDFWRLWERKGINHAWLAPFFGKNENQFTDAFDAQVIVKAAYGEQGLYFLFDVIDNNFPGIITDLNSNDAIDIYINRLPSSELYRNPFKYRIDPNRDLSRPYKEFIYSFGGSRPVESVGISQCKENYIYDHSSGERNIGLSTKSLAMSRNDAYQKNGIAIKRVVRGPGHRYQEWFIPWSMCGNPGISSPPAKGTALACSFLYHDVDSAEMNLTKKENSTHIKTLSWGGRGDPRKVSHRAWGDVLLGEAPANIISVEKVRKVLADAVFSVDNAPTAELIETPATTIKKLPSINHQFLFGQISINGSMVNFATSKWPYINLPTSMGKVIGNQLTEATAQSSGNRLFVLDQNNNNDFSDDPIKIWRSEESKKMYGQIYSSNRWYIDDSISLAGTAFRYYISDGGCLRRSIGYWRRDALTGKCWIDRKEYDIALWDKMLMGYGSPNWKNSLQLAIDCNLDGKVNGNDGSIDLFYNCNSQLNIIGTSFMIDHLSDDGLELYYYNQTTDKSKRFDAIIGANAPEFSGVDTKGSIISLKEELQKNTYEIIYFYSDECAPVNTENGLWPINKLRRTIEHFIRPIGLIGVKAGIESTAMTNAFPIIVEPKGLKGPIMSRYNVSTLPLIICLDQNGKIIFRGNEYWLIPAIWKASARNDLQDAIDFFEHKK